MRKYSFSTQQYSNTRTINLDERCNSLVVINRGTDIAYVNDIPLFPAADPTTANGDTITIGGNDGEILQGRIDIKFLGDPDFTRSVIVIQKYYIC